MLSSNEESSEWPSNRRPIDRDTCQSYRPPGGASTDSDGISAQSRGVDSLFPAQPVGYINDFANLIDPATEAALDTLVQRLKAATGAEVVAVTLPSIGQYEGPEVALAIGRRWGVGAKADPGDPRRNAGSWCCWSFLARTTSPEPDTSASRWGTASRES